MADEVDLDALVRRVDPDRWLSSRFIADAERRADVIALYAFDYELVRASKVTSNPLIAEIRLTWWREALDKIYGSSEIHGHPTARALAVAARRRGLPRETMNFLIDARVENLRDPGFDSEPRREWAGGAGSATAVLAARVLDPDVWPEGIRDAGWAWGLAMLRRSSAEESPDLDWAIKSSLRQAKAESRRVSSTVFPAVAHATLIRTHLERRSWSALGARARLVWAVSRGRL